MKEFRINKINYRIGLVINSLLIFLGIGIITLPIWILKYKHTYITVGEKTVTSHSGIIMKKKIDTTIKRIDEVRVEQDIFGEKLGYGDLIIISNSIAHHNRLIENPNELKELIQEQMD